MENLEQAVNNFTHKMVINMKINEEIKKAKFIKRPNRFIAHVNIDEREVVVHVPNTGRCKELLIEGTDIILRKGEKEGRKTPYDLISVYKGDKLINIDSQAPNKIVHEALSNGKIESLLRYQDIKREKKFGNSRFDFYLTNSDEEYYLEVKGVTLEEDGIVKFPDAPTQRGARHIRELIHLKKSGTGAGILFLIQMNGVKHFEPNIERDQEFYEALKEAKMHGVDIMAYECLVDEDEIILDKQVKVII